MPDNRRMLIEGYQAKVPKGGKRDAGNGLSAWFRGYKPKGGTGSTLPTADQLPKGSAAQSAITIGPPRKK